MARSTVVVLKTGPKGVLDDYGRLMRLSRYGDFVRRDIDIILKLNLSWTRYFPACSSTPWQVEGVIKTLLDDGYERERIFPVENRTVVTNPIKGAINNKWLPVLERYGLHFTPLTTVRWIKYETRTKLLR
ncbi:MAG TPA: DUF362 domain-containing protein, partial [bacterium]|nr:DUF362 domain-containing protein [bacterium]